MRSATRLWVPLETPRHQCYSLVISEKDLADLALNGLRSHIKEKLEGYEFLTVNQVLQRALAQESRSKDAKFKPDRLSILLTLLSAPDLYTASARFRVTFPSEYSHKVYQSTEPKRQETIY